MKDRKNFCCELRLQKEKKSGKGEGVEGSYPTQILFAGGGGLLLTDIRSSVFRTTIDFRYVNKFEAFCKIIYVDQRPTYLRTG
jgi:hypothetical protein